MPRAAGKKDPNKPKGKKGAYIFFLEDERKKAGGKVDFTKFSKGCSECWKKITEEEKQKYIDLATQDKQRYMEEMAEYSPPSSDDEGGNGSRKKRKAKKMKDPDHPKRNMSAYLHFSNAKRPSVKAEYPEATIGDLAKHIANIWNKMNDVEKGPYNELAQIDKERYIEKLASFKKSKANAEE